MTVLGRATLSQSRALKIRDQHDETGALLATLEPLGTEIRSRLDLAEKALGKAEDHYKAAGLQLIEVKKRIAAGGPDGDGASTFEAFLKQHAIGRSRAYDMIAIADGRKTLEGIRAKTAQRVAAHADRSRTALASVSNGQSAKLRKKAERGAELASREERDSVERQRDMQADELAARLAMLLLSSTTPEALRQIRDVLQSESIAEIHELRYHCGIKYSPILKAIDRALADVDTGPGDLLAAFDRSRHGEIFNLLFSAPAGVTDKPLEAALGAYDALGLEDRLCFHDLRPEPLLRLAAA
ncbi:hypothetical protein CWB41_04675 [Methylovirgula ligni]|uniref:Uncharacterized protein n=1 Tax=Methylovirgula ligni TaxID=569860 RepID=A0A3D9Z3C6_9HYPH|nr:hypothetical protein [Methylovirgula ligni]QAY95109.1 hypothetical protein CWB41_04675 [Methylovirgula ligni]REF89607.1 hypothetical protein DES32_0834 [Methylovirgula ligni]